VWIRCTVAALAVVVALGAAMPAWARLVAGPRAHACSCEIRGAHAGHGQAACACPICFPELNDVDTFGAPSLTGRCGIDDPGWRTLASPAVPSSDFVLVSPLGRAALPTAPPLSPTQWAARPELPPPRSLVV
jgi:hypothetical protein